MFSNNTLVCINPDTTLSVCIFLYVSFTYNSLSGLYALYTRNNFVSKRNKAKVHTLGSPREGKVVPLCAASCNHNCKNNVIIILKIEILEYKRNFNGILKSFVWPLNIHILFLKTNYFQKWFLYKGLMNFVYYPWKIMFPLTLSSSNGVIIL